LVCDEEAMSNEDQEEFETWNFHDIVSCKTEPVEEDIGPNGAQAAVGGDFWNRGTELTVGFMRQAPNGREIVLKAVSIWQKILGNDLKFRFVDDWKNADIRVDFEKSDGHHSYVGKVNARVSKTEKTLNLDPNTKNFDVPTALHEFGHVIGLTHEHQNPWGAIKWNEDAVYAEFEKPPNYWNKQKTREQILNPSDKNRVKPGYRYDPWSIMHYVYDPAMINTEETKVNFSSLFPSSQLNDAFNQLFKTKSKLSEGDIISVKEFYGAALVPLSPDPFSGLSLNVNEKAQLSKWIQDEIGGPSLLADWEEKDFVEAAESLPKKLKEVAVMFFKQAKSKNSQS
jgi:hypothetical protein